MSRSTILISISCVLILVLYLFYIHTTIEIGLQNIVYAEWLTKLDAVRHENMRLREEIASHSAFTTIEKEVKDTFVPARYLYLPE
jgi:hypothetical protein